MLVQVDELCSALKELAVNLENLHLPIVSNITFGYDWLIICGPTESHRQVPNTVTGQKLRH